MPRIRVKAMGLKPAKRPKPAKWKGVTPGKGYVPKQTAKTVGRRMADPNKPIQPNPHPKPAPTNHTKDYQAGRISKADYKQKMASIGSSPAEKRYAAGVRNDPAQHAATAKSINSERRTRLKDRERERPKTAVNPKPKNSPVTSKPPAPSMPKPASPVGRRPTNAQDLISHLRKEGAKSSSKPRRNRYK